jgi:hypothetical protein
LSAVVVQHLTRSPIQGRLSELQTNPKGIIDFEVELMSPQLSAMLASEMTWGELRVRLQDKRSNVSPVRRNVQ